MMKHIKLFESFVNEMTLTHHFERRFVLRVKNLIVKDDGGSNIAYEDIKKKVLDVVHDLWEKMRTGTYYYTGILDFGDIAFFNKDGMGPFYPTFLVPKEHGDDRKYEGNCFLIMCQSNVAITIYLVPSGLSIAEKIDMYKNYVAYKNTLSSKSIEKMKVEHRYIKDAVNDINMTPPVSEPTLQKKPAEFKYRDRSGRRMRVFIPKK